MKAVLLWFGFVAFLSVANAKSDYLSDISEDDYKKLQVIARYLRKRVEEAEAAEEISKGEAQGGPFAGDSNPAFEYDLAKVKGKDENDPAFAIGPSDPRYYQDFPAAGSATPNNLDDSYGKEEKRPEAKDQSKDASRELTDEVPMVSDNKNPSYFASRQVTVEKVVKDEDKADIYFTAIVAGCSAAAVVAVIAIGFGCYRLQKNAKAAADVEYPAYGVTGPNKDISPSSGDRRLAQSAQMYHYQHQKQQIIAMESMSNKDRRSSISDAESEEENEEGDYTVYECPGLAPTGEMEVKNPLFQDDQTPSSVTKQGNECSEDCRELPNLITFN